MLIRFIKFITGKGEWHIDYYRDSGAEWHFNTKVHHDNSLWCVLKTFIQDSWYLVKHSEKEW